MLKQKMNGMNAATLRLLLGITIVLLIALGCGLFWFAYTKLKASAVEVQAINAQAASSGENLTTLRNMETKLASSTESIDRAKAIVAESQLYQYQDTIIQDLESYAGKSQLGISSYSFAGGGEAGGNKSGAATAPAATPSASATPGAAAPTTTGLKSTTVSVQLAGNTRYENLMTFIRFIEQNLTKMQLSGISLTRDPQTNAINSGELTVEVYIR